MVALIDQELDMVYKLQAQGLFNFEMALIAEGQHQFFLAPWRTFLYQCRILLTAAECRKFSTIPLAVLGSILVAFSLASCAA